MDTNTNKIPSMIEVEKQLKKDAEKKAKAEAEAKLEAEKKEKEELKKALEKSKKELEEAQLRNEIEIEKEIQHRLKTAKDKETSDIYIKLTALDNFNWGALFTIKKDETVTIKQSRFDYLANNVGNFKDALETGRIRIV